MAVYETHEGVGVLVMVRVAVTVRVAVMVLVVGFALTVMVLVEAVCGSTVLRRTVSRSSKRNGGNASYDEQQRR